MAIGSVFKPHWWSTPPAVSRYVVTLTSVTSAVVLAWVLDHYWQSTPYVSLFLCAIMCSAWFGGLRQGLLAITLSTLAFTYFFLPPIHSFAVNASELPRLTVFVVAALLVGFIAASQRRAMESLRRARDDLASKVRELQRVNEALHVENAERKRAEAALRRSETYLAAAQRLSQTGSFGWKVSSGEISWSGETFRIFQYNSATKPTVELILERVHPEDRNRVKETIERASQKGGDFDFEHRLLMPDGSVKHLRVMACAEQSAMGALEFVGAVMDVTVIKEVEDKIRLIINTVPGLLWTARPDGWVDFLNQRWLDYTGMTLEQGLGWAWQPGYHPDDLGNVLCKWKAAVAEGKPLEVEARLRRFDGEYRWFLKRAFPLFDRAGRVLGWYGGNIDIHDLKQAEEKLRESEAYLAEAQRLSHTGSWAWKVKTKENLYWSKEHYRIYGFDPETESGQFEAARERIHPEDARAFDEALERAIQERGDFEMLHRIVLPGGEVKHIHTLGHPVLSDSGELVEYIGTAMDITERKQAEEALRSAQSELTHITRITTMGELTASIAHEVNQPLTAVVNNANACLSLLPNGAPDLEEVRDALTEIIDDADRASAVITRVRQLAKKAPSERSLLDLKDVIMDVLALARHESSTRRVIIRTELPNELLCVSGDRVQLQQVLLNLVVNGMDAMNTVEESKRVLIICAHHETRDGKREAFVSVQDAGTGFKTEEMGRLFEAFYTTKAQGMGMGLAISRSIIEAHGGRLWAEANQGPGATFLFSLPVAGNAGL